MGEHTDLSESYFVADSTNRVKGCAHKMVHRSLSSIQSLILIPNYHTSLKWVWWEIKLQLQLLNICCDFEKRLRSLKWLNG